MNGCQVEFPRPFSHTRPRVRPRPRPRTSGACRRRVCVSPRALGPPSASWLGGGRLSIGGRELGLGTVADRTLGWSRSWPIREGRNALLIRFSSLRAWAHASRWDLPLPGRNERTSHEHRLRRWASRATETWVRLNSGCWPRRVGGVALLFSSPHPPHLQLSSIQYRYNPYPRPIPFTRLSTPLSRSLHGHHVMLRGPHADAAPSSSSTFASSFSPLPSSVRTWPHSITSLP